MGSDIQKWQKSMGIPLVPTARGYAQLGAHFAEMGNCEIAVLPIQAYGESGFYVRKVLKSKQDRRRKEFIDVDSSVVSLREFFANCISNAVNMFPGNYTTGRV